MRRSNVPTRVAAFAVTGLALAGILVGAGPAVAAGPGSLSVSFTADDLQFSAVSSDGATIVLSSYSDSTITLIDTVTNAATTVADPGGDILGPGMAVFSNDNATIYVANYGDGSGNGNLLVIDVATAEVTSVLTDSDGLFEGPWVLAKNSDGTVLYVGDYDAQRLFFFDIASVTVTTSVDISAQTPEIYGLFTSADATQLFAVDFDGSIEVISTSTGASTDVWTDAAPITSVGSCISPDRTALFQPDSDSSSLVKSSLLTGEVLASNLATVQPQGSEHSTCAVSPDGSSVFVSHFNATAPGSISEYNASTLAFIATYDFPDIAYTQQIRFFSDCQAYVAGYFGDAQTFDLDCAAAPELAATGTDSAVTGFAALLAALLLSLGGIALALRRRYSAVRSNQ